MTIGPLQDTFVAAAAALAREAWDVPPRPARIERRLRAKRARAVVAIAEDGTIAAITTATILRGGRARSEETVVAAAWRGQGLAERVLDAMTRWLAADGVHVLEGESSLRRPKALAFFERYGFHVVGGFRSNGRDGYSRGTWVLRTRLALPRRAATYVPPPSLPASP